MGSGPIIAMVWTGLGIVPIVRAMVGATRPIDAAPGSIRGDLCIDVGRNLIHASDSAEAAKKEVAMWFQKTEIVQWRPADLEWTYEDEVDEDNLPKCSVIADMNFTEENWMKPDKSYFGFLVRNDTRIYLLTPLKNCENTFCKVHRS